MSRDAPLGKHHPLVRRLRTLRRDRSARDAERVFLAEGMHLAEEALANGASIERAVVGNALEAVDGGPELLRRLTREAVPVERTSDTVLEGLQDARSPQPVLLVVRRPDPVPVGASDRPLVVAYGLQDPGNLGAVVRTADAAGAAEVVVAGGADPFHPRAVRATMGSIFRLPIRSVAMPVEPARVAPPGTRHVGAVPRGGQRHDALDWSGPLALWLGGEGAGLPATLVGRMDALVSVRMRDGVESLSVGAAAAVLLFAAASARG